MPPFGQVDKTLPESSGGLDSSTESPFALSPYLDNQDNDTEHILYFGKNCKCQVVVQHKGLKVMLSLSGTEWNAYCEFQN